MRYARHLFEQGLDNISKTVIWELGVPFYNSLPCYHGGSFFKAIGETFTNLENKDNIINADVLDAWFNPCPEIIDLLKTNTEWILKTSPPTNGDGLIQAISKARNISEESILINSGSSSLMYLSFNILLNQDSRVLVLDPSYGEYLHLCNEVIQCKVDRYELDIEKEYVPDFKELKQILKEKKYDLFILVNPNNPSGKYIPKNDVIDLLKQVEKRTLVWIDETYIEYTGNYSIENMVSDYPNLMICKSMSKVYALSGARVAYLCAHPFIISKLKRFLPPWSVSLPAQMAAVKVLLNKEYYQNLYKITHDNRTKMITELRKIDGLKIIDGEINSIIIFFNNINIEKIFNECKKYGLFIRPFYNVGKQSKDNFIRIAVKDEETNIKICKILDRVVSFLIRQNEVFLEKKDS